jgi:hypothetical protein
MQIAGLHRFVSPAEFDVFIFFWEGKKDSAFETLLKTFQILCQKKNKDPLWRPCPLNRRISAVEGKSPAILHLLGRPLCYIFAIHEVTMI